MSFFTEISKAKFTSKNDDDDGGFPGWPNQSDPEAETREEAPKVSFCNSFEYLHLILKSSLSGCSKETS